MKKAQTRLEALEAHFLQDDEPIFFDRIGEPWTEEEKQEAIRNNPNDKVFWRRLSTITPYEDLVKAQDKGRENQSEE